jgi:TPR repeat protein
MKSNKNRYQKAAEGNHPEAQNTLGYCYEHGIYVKKDIDKAVFW